VTDTEPPAPPTERGRRLPDWWPVLAQVLGVLAVSVGFGLLAVWAGVVVGGVGLLCVGTVAEIERGE
jgi:hypothetical protein